MAKPTGFLESPRRGPQRRPVQLRLTDWNEVYENQSTDDVRTQASRCMDCGIAFCHHACPLGNLIPEWNDLAYQDKFEDALERLHSTNNFPEFTGRLCPAPCESACVLAIADEPVTIERLEYEIIERGYAHDLVRARPPLLEYAERVAIVGSGPAGLAAAQQLRRAGYQVTVFERHESIGGLLRFGIPEFKMEKAVIDRRLDQLRDEGVQFRVNINVGVDGDITLDQLREEFDAVLLAIGSTRPRNLNVPGRDLGGVMFAMQYLKPANLALLGTPLPPECDAQGRDVIILGGGDTGADCLGTALRQGAASVTQLEIMDRPPDSRPSDQPWPTMPAIYKVTSAHEEGGVREYSAETLEFMGDSQGRVRSLRVRENGSDVAVETEITGDLVLIAAGFLGPEVDSIGTSSVRLTARESIQVTPEWLCLEGDETYCAVFACGDAVRGQSLIVWAIAEGRSAASCIDGVFRVQPSTLPSPLTPYLNPWEM